MADGRLRERVQRYLSERLPRQGSLPRGRFCGHCRSRPRYPDHHCAEHTAYLPEGGASARAADSDDARWLALWRGFFERLDRLLKT